MAVKQLVGVLGGMGPAATADFLTKLVRATPASRDQDHIPVVMWSDPRIPDRSAALTGAGPDPTAALESGIRLLQSAGATLLAVPCNTAHAFVRPIIKRTTLEFVDMIDSAADRANATCPAGAAVGILATDGTLEAGLYRRAFERVGLEQVQPRPEDQRRLMSVIRRVKAGDVGREVRAAMVSIVEALVQRGASVIVEGCSEVPVALTGSNVSATLLDSTQVLADAVVDRAHCQPG